MSSLFWVRGLSTSVYVKNRCIHSSLTHGTPYELFYGRKPDLGNLRVFGCKAYVYVQKKFRQKLDIRFRCGVFVGHEENSLGYLVILPIEGGRYKKSYDA